MGTSPLVPTDDAHCCNCTAADGRVCLHTSRPRFCDLHIVLWLKHVASLPPNVHIQELD